MSPNIAHTSSSRHRVNDVTKTLMESNVDHYIHRYIFYSALDLEKFLDSDISNDLKMALLRKLFKRNKRNCSIEEESSLCTENNTTEKTFITDHKIVPANISDTSVNEEIPRGTEGTDIDEMVDKELYYKRKQLNNALRKAR